MNTLNSFGNYKKISNETPKTFYFLNIQTSMNEFYGEFMFKSVSIKTNDHGNVKISQDEKIEFHKTQIKNENCHNCFHIMENNKCMNSVHKIL